MKPDYAKVAKYCNLWRNNIDVDDTWESVLGIIEFYGQDKTKFVEVAGPGNWNDPDMVRPDRSFSLCGFFGFLRIFVYGFL